MWLVLRIKTVLRGMILPPAGPLLLAVLGIGFGPIAPLSTTALQNTVAMPVPVVLGVAP